MRSTRTLPEFATITVEDEGLLTSHVGAPASLRDRAAAAPAEPAAILILGSLLIRL